ncbi:MAG: GIY-YIG nuclease family protein [Rhodobacteraceae bacterium]|nr:GIY-YIG nuclease family protein [Paracoccaceae bacterium]
MYVLSNATMKDVVKSGFTTETPEERASGLSASKGVPKKFKVEWSLAVQSDQKAVGQRVHAQLKPKSAGKEFFRVSVEDAKDTILDAHHIVAPAERDALDASVLQRNPESYLNPFVPVFQRDRMTRLCEPLSKCVTNVIQIRLEQCAETLDGPSLEARQDLVVPDALSTQV